MPRWSRTLVALPVATLAMSLAGPAVAAPSAAPAPAATAATTATGAPTAPRARPQHDVTRLIVRMRDGGAPSAAALSATASLVGAPRAAVVRRMARSRTLVSLGRAVSVDQAWAAARALTARGDVVYAEPDLWVYPTADNPSPTNDPRLPEQWDLWDAAAASPAGGYSSKAPGAWTRTTGVPTVVVAVIDTGITAHPDIAPTSLVSGYDMIADTSTANDGNGRDNDPSDPGDWVTKAESQAANGPFSGCTIENSSWHGTHVTGTIVATADNGIGIAGTAPGVRVQPVRALGKCGGWSSDIDDAITWASGGSVPGVPANSTPATVINMSLGGPGACLTSTQDAIDGARARGTTVVVAAGNDGRSFDGGGSQPADCTGVISVEASTRSGTLASYSNFGTVAGSVGLAAPGGDRTPGTGTILSTINTGTTVPAAPGYATYIGTSMATPHVAAAVALIQSRLTTRLTPDQVRARLRATAVPWPAAAGCTAVRCGPGILDIAAALPDPPDAPAAVDAGGSRATVTLSWSAPSANGSAITAYHVQGRIGAGAWKDVVARTPTTATTLSITQFADATRIVDSTTYTFRVSAINGVSEGAATESPTVTPTTISAPLLPDAPTVTGGVERITATWTPPADGGSPITEQGARYRKVGATDWSCLVGVAPDCTTTDPALRTATGTTWPLPMPAGSYEVQTRAGNALGSGLWSPSGTAEVGALVETVTSSARVVRPFRDGFQDYTVLRVRTNRPGGSDGLLRLVTSTGRVVFQSRLAAASAWTVVWRGTTTAGAALPPGRYTVRLYLRGRSTSVALTVGPTVTLATSQASRPVITLSARVLYPVRDGFGDSVRITSTAVVPSRMTWKLVRAGRTWWSTTWSRRTTATGSYAGRRNGGGTVPAGTYTLYVYAAGGEGRTTVAARTLVVSAKREVAQPFAVTLTAYSAAQSGLALGEGLSPTFDAASGTVTLPQLSRVAFLAPLPASLRGYSSIRVRVASVTAQGAPQALGGYYTGSPAAPTLLLPFTPLAVGTSLLPVAPTSALASRRVHWFLQNGQPSSSQWRVRSFVVTGYRWVLA